MFISSISEAAQQAAERAYSDISVRIGGCMPEWDITIGRQQITRFSKFLRDFCDELGDISSAIELCQNDDSSKPIVTASDIQTANSNNLIICIDTNLRLLGFLNPANGWDRLRECAEMSRLSKGRVIAYYEGRTLLYYFADREVTATVDPRSEAKPAGKQGRHRRRAEDYRQAILDHYRAEVRDPGKACDHWKTHTKRILRKNLGKAQITEDIFVHSLLRWLHENLDARIVTKAGLITQDETDIEISSLNTSAIIEVKWLGINESQTERRIPRISSGIQQLKSYLDKSPSVHSAVILAYDGRVKSDFDNLDNCTIIEDGAKELSECESIKVPARGSCIVLFLKSVTGSTI